jgi:hypothetical protein
MGHCCYIFPSGKILFPEGLFPRRLHSKELPAPEPTSMEIFWQRTLQISMLGCGFVSFLAPGKAIAGRSYVFSGDF